MEQVVGVGRPLLSIAVLIAVATITQGIKMKRLFELLIFSGANTVVQTDAVASVASASVIQTDTAASAIDASALLNGGASSGARQGGKWQEREAELKALAATLRMAVHTEEALVGPTEDTIACDVEWPIFKIGRDAVLLLAGSPSSEQLTDAVATLKKYGHDLIVVVDALKDLPELMSTLVHLNEQSVGMAVTAGVEKLVIEDHLMMYRYPKADQTATIAMFADIDADDPLVLTMVRGQDPFKGMESFPGGFLNVQLESLPECAARELMEECFVNPKKTGVHDRFSYHISATDMVLVDVRSDPGRDERGHVVDHGFAYFIPKDRQAEVLSKLNAGDDAQAGSARFVRVSELKNRALAFDHKKLLDAALLRLKERRSSGVASANA